MSLSHPLLTLVAATLALVLAPVAHAAPPEAPAALAAAPAQAGADVREKAIFAVTEADPQKWAFVLGNIANAVDGLGAGHADIELVVYGPAIAMLKKDSPVAARLDAAIKGGVRVAACQNSMRNFKIDAAELAPGVTPVPAGVVELIRRQHDGYAYVRS